MRDHAEILVTDGATAQSLTSIPAKMTGFATAGKESGNSCVGAVASDKITVRGGRYLVRFNVSGYAASAQTVQAVLRKGTTEITSGQCKNSFATGSALGTMGFTTIIDIAAADLTDGQADLSIYLESGGNVDFTPVFGNLVVERID